MLFITRIYRKSLPPIINKPSISPIPLRIIKYCTFMHRYNDALSFLLELYTANGLLDIVKCLVYNDVKISIKILSFAAESGHLKLFKFLYSMTNQKFPDPLSMIPCYKHPSIVKFLYSIGDITKFPPLNFIPYNKKVIKIIQKISL